MAKQHHDSKVLEFARKLGSRQAGFIFAVIGVLSQWVHVFYITYHLSSLDGVTKFIQAGTMSLFFNAALLYFILKRGSVEDEEIAARYKRLIFWFAALEIFMNLYYWGSKFIIEPWPEADWSKLIIAIPMAVILPITLAAYSFEIRVDDFSENDEHDSDTGSQQIDPLVEEKFLHELSTKLQHGDVVDFEFEYMQNGELKTKILRNVKLLPTTNGNNPENQELAGIEDTGTDNNQTDVESGTKSSGEIEQEKPEEISNQSEHKVEEPEELPEPVSESTEQVSEPVSDQVPEQSEKSVKDEIDDPEKSLFDYTKSDPA